jgi:sulfotransferase family protein
MPVAIAGMHRAGTSMVARVLRICGLDLGDERHFAPAAPDNTEGYWEDLRFVSMNDRILDAFGGAWDTPPALPDGWTRDPRLDGIRREAEAIAAARAEPWGWKDPRTSLTAAFWRDVWPALRFVVCVRNPLEVAASLRARGYTSERFGLRLWEDYHRALDAAALGAPQIVTHYDSYFRDASAEVARVVDFAVPAATAALRHAAVESASEGARHQRRSARDLASSGLTAAGGAQYASLGARAGPVFAQVVQAPAAEEPDPPPAPAAPARRPADREAEIAAVLAAREEELAIALPMLHARDEELASIRPVLAARDEEIAAFHQVLAAREAEIAGLKAALLAHEQEAAARRAEIRALTWWRFWNRG